MDVYDEIDAYRSALASAYDMVESKGGILPANKNLNNLVNAIDSIEEES